MRCQPAIVDPREVVLRHAPSGRVLDDGAAAVRFRSREDAEAFRARYLDEQDAWRAVPAAPEAHRAA
jgi:hypothetical protein